MMGGTRRLVAIRIGSGRRMGIVALRGSAAICQGIVIGEASRRRYLRRLRIWIVWILLRGSRVGVISMLRQH